jgi:hypothetical protein
MSVVAIGVSSLIPGGVLLAGLIVGGIIIGSVFTNDLDVAENFDEEQGKNTLEANKADLLNEFNKSIIMVMGDLHILGAEFVKELSTEADKLKEVADNLLGKYTLDVFKSGGHAKYLNFMINEFNSKVLEIRYKIEEIKLGVFESRKIIEAKIGEIEKVFQNLEIPQNYREDYIGLKNKLDSLKSNSSVKEQEILLPKLVEEFSRFSEICNLSNKINLATLQEEKISIKQTDSPEKILKKEIGNFHERIKYLDAGVYNELEPIIAEAGQKVPLQRLELIRDQVKLKYGSLKENIVLTNSFKYKLAKLAGALPAFKGSEELLEQLNFMLGSRTISQNDFAEITRRVNEFVAHARKPELLKADKKKLAGKIKKSLENIGYHVFDDTNNRENVLEKLENGEIIHLDTEWPEYKVMLKLDDNNQVATRLVKFVANEAEKIKITEYQKQKDSEVAHKWCSNYDKFLEEMRNSGVGISVKLRKEPGDEGVSYIVDPEMVKNSGRESSENLNNLKRI